MTRAGIRAPIGSRVSWCAAVLGAAFGALAIEPSASACSCAIWSWRLTLNEERVDGSVVPATGAWPEVATLESRPGTIIVWSEDITADKIDYLHVGEP
jgi:hypothetical protein